MRETPVAYICAALLAIIPFSVLYLAYGFAPVEYALTGRLLWTAFFSLKSIVGILQGLLLIWLILVTLYIGARVIVGAGLFSVAALLSPILVLLWGVNGINPFAWFYEVYCTISDECGFMPMLPVGSGDSALGIFVGFLCATLVDGFLLYMNYLSLF